MIQAAHCPSNVSTVNYFMPRGQRISSAIVCMDDFLAEIHLGEHLHISAFHIKGVRRAKSQCQDGNNEPAVQHVVKETV